MRVLTLRQEIERECIKHIRRYGKSIAAARKQQRLFNRRTWITAGKPATYSPTHWHLNRAFDPFYVRKRLDQFVHAISLQIENETYQPQPALHFNIPKPGGGTRTIAISTIADAAVSRWLYRRLIAKNVQLLSSYAFAYRPDRTIGHAIEHLSRFTKRHPRLFIVEYDFRKYFDTISHSYLLHLVDTRLNIGRREKSVVRAFLNGRFAVEPNYRAARFERRVTGIAQGSCLSLFLANLACIELDDDLEKTGACYARFADDTVVLCRSYSQATQCALTLHGLGGKAGTELNLEKSEGISLLTTEPEPEIRGKQSFRFLGHRIGANGVSVAMETKRRMKQKLARIIFRHLLLYPSRFDQMAPTRVDIGRRIDWDLVTCINELRLYISGGLSREQIAGNEPITVGRSGLGVVSFFASVTIGDGFRELDGWLVNAMRRAIAERRRRLWQWYNIQTPMLRRDELVTGSWYHHDTIINDTSMPSFFSAWRAIRKLSVSQGVMSLPEGAYPYEA